MPQVIFTRPFSLNNKPILETEKIFRYKNHKLKICIAHLTLYRGRLNSFDVLIILKNKALYFITNTGNKPIF